ncbi:HEAT repeat domain-containing protein [Vulcanococcus sp.]|jgi:phycocyanobilin lyase alpha subunit|uniref:HEAT repeat domain-containing protein n=1 Tax=Vulcanococcus sp. TaxID=2856995 RepID=UPI0037D9BE32
MADPIDEAEALRRLRATDDPSAQYYAAWWLGRHRSQHPDTLPLLLAAMRQRRARQLGDGVEENAVARNATRAVGKLGPSASEAIPVLLELLDDPDYGLREAAARSLGELKATVALPALVARLRSGPNVAGARASDSANLVEPCEALLEAIGDLGPSDEEVIGVLQSFLAHERPVVQCSACRSLLQLTQEPRWGERLKTLLLHPQLQVRRAALMDLGATGWRPAAQAIAATLAENSLKLIALRGLVESAPSDGLDEEIFDVMDGLL